MKRLSAAQWRVMNMLSNYILHTARPRMAKVIDQQDVAEQEVRELIEVGYVTAEFPDQVDSRSRLALSASGLQRVGDPFNVVLGALDAADRPVPLSDLIDCVDITHATLCDLQQSGLIEVMSRDGQHQIVLDRRDGNYASNRVAAKLTNRGREYVAR